MRFANGDVFKLFDYDCPALFFRDTPFGDQEGPASTAGTKTHLFAANTYAKPQHFTIIPGESQQVKRPVKPP